MDSNPDLYSKIYSQNKICDEEDYGLIIDNSDDDLSI